MAVGRYNESKSHRSHAGFQKVSKNSFSFILYTIYIHLRYFSNPLEEKGAKNRKTK
jgi:hypothetical protein